jgi:hypothetical protein
MVGEIATEDGKTKFIFPESQLEHAHDTLSGKFIHGNDIKNMEGSFAKVRQSDEFKARKMKHREFITPTTKS